MGLDRGGRIIAALPSIDNLVAVATAYPVGNPLLQLRAEINDLTAVLASYVIGHIKPL